MRAKSGGEMLQEAENEINKSLIRSVRKRFKTLWKNKIFLHTETRIAGEAKKKTEKKTRTE